MTRRRRGGGRHTPKAARPRNWDDRGHGAGGQVARLRPTIPPELIELLRPIENAVHEPAAQRQLEMLMFVDDLGTIAQESPSGEMVSMTEVMIEMLGSFASSGPPSVIDTLSTLATFGGEHRLQALAELSRLKRSPSPEIVDIASGRVIGGFYIAPELSDEIDLVLEVGYDSGDSSTVVLVLSPAAEELIDAFLPAGTLKDSAVAAEQEGESVHAITEKEARGHLAHAVRFLRDMPPEPESEEEAELAVIWPLLEDLAKGLDPKPIGVWRPADEREQPAVVLSCVDYCRSTCPDVADDVATWVNTILPYGNSGGGGWDRWSPRRVFEIWSIAIGGMDAFAGRDLPWPSDSEELRSFGRAMTGIIRWGHHRAGWADRYLAEALEVSADQLEVSEVMRSFADRAQATTYRQPIEFASFTEGVPPSGGSHPEPAPAGLDERSALIAATAGRAAARLFDVEMATIAQRIAVAVGNVGDGLFSRGNPGIWASGVVYAGAQLNGLFEQGSTLSLYADELTESLEGAHGTIVAKAKQIRDALGVDSDAPVSPYAHSLRLNSAWVPGPARTESPGVVQPFGTVTVPARSPQALLLDVTLRDTKPPVKRRISVATDVTLNGLHYVLQVAMGWQDGHLHSFEVGDLRFDSDEARYHAGEADDSFATDNVALGDLLEVGDEFTYIYDFGDNWRHNIEVVSEVEVGLDMMRAVLVSGQRACPPEDVGGTGGYEELLEAVADPGKPEHAEVLLWARPWNDPDRFDLDAVGAQLAAMTLHW